MIPKSIKWRLQIWYGLILVVVLAGFGFTAYQLERGRQMRRIDDELHRRFAILADAFRPERPPGQGRPPFDGPPDRMPGDLRQRPNLASPKFDLPPWAAGLFGTNQPENYYFVIETHDGKEIAHAGNVPTYEVTEPIASHWHINRAPELQDVKPQWSLKPPPAFTENNFHESMETAPSGETIRLGCSIAPELKELRHTALNLFAVGGWILLVGLVGGWWFVSRALRPIENISAAA